MNEWLAHLCNPQLKLQQFQGLKGAMLQSIKRLYLFISLFGLNIHTYS